MMRSAKSNLTAARLDALTGQRGAEARSLTLADIETIIAPRVAAHLAGRILEPGDIVFRADTARPAGALVADGSQVSRAAYPALFAAVAGRYGLGDSVTTFNLPNVPPYGGMTAFILI